MACPQPSLLFVYGSLKRGGSNHPWLRGASWRGRARLAGYRLHNLGDYPMAVPGRGVVHGEVYAVDEAALARLDLLEDVPNEYQRLVRRLDDGRQCWVYTGSAGQVRGRPRVPFDDWDATPVFCYGSDLDPAALRRRYPAWDGTAWLARLPGWRWQVAADSWARRGVAALIRPDPQAHCWGVVIHERDPSGSSLQRLTAPSENSRFGCSPQEGWRMVNLRLEPWQAGRYGAPVGAKARVWSPGPGLLPGLPEPGGEEREAKEGRKRLLAGAMQHGLPEHWCQVLRQALGE